MPQRRHILTPAMKLGMRSMLPQRAVVERAYRFVDDEGMLPLLKRQSHFTDDAAKDRLEAELGYRLHDRTRRRMIDILFALLNEAGVLRQDGERYLVADDARLPVLLDAADRSLLKESLPGQSAFFDLCTANAAAFLRGEPSRVRFDEESSGHWQYFLENEEYAYARSLLAGMLIRERKREARLLDLCCGTGAGALMIRRLWPDVSVTVIDAHDFAGIADTIACDKAIVWDSSLIWQGFGTPVPFSDGSFDAVLFACADPYIPAALREYVYADILRILRPGGSLGVLSRSLPDAACRYVRDPWMRKAALAHDFLESVCGGWQGFSDPHQSAGLFARVGYTVDRIMLDATIWKLDKPGKE